MIHMITALYAGILGLIYVFLSFFVIKGRFQHRVSLGDGQNDDLVRRIRLHSNFIEYVPLALFLIFLIEYNQLSDWVIHGLGGMLLLGRILHPFGMLFKNGVSFYRTGGMIMTLCVLIIASVLCLLSFL